MSARGLKREGGGRGDAAELGHWLDAAEETEALRPLPCLAGVPLVAYGEYRRTLWTEGAVWAGWWRASGDARISLLVTRRCKPRCVAYEGDMVPSGTVARVDVVALALNISTRLSVTWEASLSRLGGLGTGDGGRLFGAQHLHFPVMRQLQGLSRFCTARVSKVRAYR